MSIFCQKQAAALPDFIREGSRLFLIIEKKIIFGWVRLNALSARGNEVTPFVGTIESYLTLKTALQSDL